MDEKFEKLPLENFARNECSRTAGLAKGFFDHVMRSEESYSQKWLYVAENPVRKKLAARPGDWPYQGEIYPLEARGHIL